MKNSTHLRTVVSLLILSFLGFTKIVHGQQQHSPMEELFENYSLRTFENDLQLVPSDYENQGLLDFIDDRYQNFAIAIRERLDAGETIATLDFEADWMSLVSTTSTAINTMSRLPSEQGDTRAPDGPCINMDFETGDFTGWTLTRGDVDGSVPYSYVGEFGVGPGPYHTIFAGGVDPVTGIQCVNTLGGAFSVRLGNGTGTGARGARMRQTFLVDASNYLFTYSYAVIFQSPNGHTLNELPYFTVRVFDELGNNIPCGEYSVIADAASAPDYQSIVSGGSTILYQNWQTVFTNLLAYIGQNITIEFTSGDCSLTGHYGYAYVDASCSMEQIIASDNIICAGDPAILTAPNGAASYLWSNGATTQSTTVF